MSSNNNISKPRCRYKMMCNHQLKCRKLMYKKDKQTHPYIREIENNFGVSIGTGCPRYRLQYRSQYGCSNCECQPMITLNSECRKCINCIPKIHFSEEECKHIDET